MAHLGRRLADHHFKAYICGSRNGIAILDSDKTLICLRDALLWVSEHIIIAGLTTTGKDSILNGMTKS
jgi:ribosomal protein S2